MARRMLIDASHPEETRVVVVDGTRLEEFDFEGGGEQSLAIVLGESRPRDTLTLWHLLPRVDEAGRKKVLDRMIALGARTANKPGD